MARAPLKRQCNLGVVADDGSVIAFPRLNHLRSGLSHGRWRTLSPGEKIERLLGMNLYRVAEILSWKPITELDPLRALVTMQVIRVGRCGSNLPVPGRSGRSAIGATLPLPHASVNSLHHPICRPSPSCRPTVEFTTYALAKRLRQTGFYN
jgi:hypothetical protein